MLDTVNPDNHTDTPKLRKSFDRLKQSPLVPKEKAPEKFQQLLKSALNVNIDLENNFQKNLKEISLSAQQILKI